MVFEKLQAHVLEKYPNPDRIGCIDHETLETWVYSPEKLDLSDPKYLHVLKCAECTRELIELRKQRDANIGRAAIPAVSKESERASRRWIGVAAVLFCCFVVGSLGYWQIHSRMVPATPVAQTIDLSQDGTTRGGYLDRSAGIPSPTCRLQRTFYCRFSIQAAATLSLSHETTM